MYRTVSDLLNNPRRIGYLKEQYMKEMFKFKNHDIQFLKLFWQPEFDESWVLLDEPFIETWLIQDTNLNLIQLYQQILFTMFHKDADYKLSLEVNSESMYIVKGHCLKDLCIICNKLFRDFFVRLARVAHMLVLTKSIEDNTTQIKLGRATRQLDALSSKTDNLTFLVEEIVSERLAEVADKVIPGSKCEEVVNLIKLPQSFSASPHMPSHLRGAGYIVIRCLRKNYDKHLNRVKAYSADGCGVEMEEVFESPVANGGVDVVKALRKLGVKTHKSNGVSTDDHIVLMEKVKVILGLEDEVDDMVQA
jgi:hypothetical protein